MRARLFIAPLVVVVIAAAVVIGRSSITPASAQTKLAGPPLYEEIISWCFAAHAGNPCTPVITDLSDGWVRIIFNPAYETFPRKTREIGCTKLVLPVGIEGTVMFAGSDKDLLISVTDARANPDLRYCELVIHRTS